MYPPDPVGNPNGGQGGDGTIAHNITNQYVAGWDWIQPVRDRNTGIWDKVLIKKTKQVTISNTHVMTSVPGTPTSQGKQAAAIINATTEIENTSGVIVNGTLVWEIEGHKVTAALSLVPGRQVIGMLPITLHDPKLWWPNGYGRQDLYKLKVQFLVDGKVLSDEEQVTVGVRQIDAVWNAHTKSRELRVNGQRIFIKGGNRILSDELLRFTNERYDAEIRMHRDMNLNMIRVWGGGITERPEFYDACDKYGLLVMQDFWVSGDCNGRWDDPMKLEDTLARRNYPDDHRLLAASLADQVKMLRNHPSLAIWCGGNEIRLPADVLIPFRDSVLPKLDGTRIFFEYSNDDSMSYQSGDGPYTIQPDSFFWAHRSFPFNSEVGSVGIGDYESIERFIPKQNMVVPEYDKKNKKWQVDPVWQYHKYVGYDSAIEVYGHPKDVQDFAKKAQLVNYNQYRALMEGATAHMWDWYTGIIEWKTQNPWTAMVGQMYDVYLDPNACMYGLQEGAKPVHIMYDPVREEILLVNTTADTVRDIMVEAVPYYKFGYGSPALKRVSIPPDTCIVFRPDVRDTLRGRADVQHFSSEGGIFLELTLSDTDRNLIDENVYFLPDEKGSYKLLNDLKYNNIIASAKYINDGEVEVKIKNDKNNFFAFFNRISIVDKKTKRRILPAFSNNNYISVFYGWEKTMRITFKPEQGVTPMVAIEGWNTGLRYIDIKH